MTHRTDRRAIWGWMLFDPATQPFHTLIITFIFAPYFTSAVIGDPVAGQAMWGYAVAAAGLAIALFSPVLGAIADSTGPRKPWLAGFGLVYVGACLALWQATPGMANPLPVLMAVALGMMAVEFSTTFNNASLPDVAPPGMTGQLSGNGWALGYAGGVVALALVLAFLAESEAGVTLLGLAPVGGLDPALREGTRAVGPLVALWFVVLMIPVLLWVPERPRLRPSRGALRRGLADLGASLRALPRRRDMGRYLLSAMAYHDGLNGLYAFGGIYAAGVLGLSVVQVGVFGIVAALSGALGAWIGGRMDRRHGPRPLLMVSLVMLIGTCLLVVATGRSTVLGMPVAPGSPVPEAVFYLCGALIGVFGGTLQAASRTMLVALADPARMTESFGLFALSGKVTTFVAPLSIAIVTDLSGSQQIGVLPVVVLFALGLVLLRGVKAAA